MNPLVLRNNHFFVFKIISFFNDGELLYVYYRV